MSGEISRRLDRFEAYLSGRPDLRLRVCCPSQEFAELEMAQGLGRWLSCVRGLWESLSVGCEEDLAVLMFQAPPVPAAVERYLLSLVPTGTVGDRLLRHALIGLPDSSERHLSEKLLERPELLERTRLLIARARARGQVVEPLSCYQSSPRIDEIAAWLGLQVGESPSNTLRWGSKSGSRTVFRAARLPHAAGSYDPVRGLPALAQHAAALARTHGPGRWLVKIDDGYGSGHGIASVTLTDTRYAAVLNALDNLTPLTANISRTEFLAGVAANGAIVEKYLSTPCGGLKRSPSTLLHIRGNPDGGFTTELLGTHEQILGEDLQYLGCRFPADPAYRAAISDMSLTAAKELGRLGIRGHVGIDFITRQSPDGRWEASATELNLRQTGTTHPHRTVRALVPGTWREDGRLTHHGTDIHYTGTDAIIDPAYQGLTPQAVIRALATRPGLTFDQQQARGVIPHFWTALEPHGKIGATVIGHSPQDCDHLRQHFTTLLNTLPPTPPGTPR
ncbi:hypothetical protein ACWDYJ_09290 [Streptomyces sp. NPDC003042]